MYLVRASLHPPDCLVATAHHHATHLCLAWHNVLGACLTPRVHLHDLAQQVLEDFVIGLHGQEETGRGGSGGARQLLMLQPLSLDCTGRERQAEVSQVGPDSY